MRTACFTAQGRFEIHTEQRPIAAAGEVVIDVTACGICGSDLHFYTGESPAPRVCPGHEICGRVAAESTALEPGLLVVVEPFRACGTCLQCRSGEPHLCPHVAILGSRSAGGFAEAVLAPVSAVYPVPAGLDPETAMLAEPLAVAVHGVDRGNLGAGADVLVIGGGTIGLLTTFVAARRGAAVTISVRYPHQREAARLLGASRVVVGDREAILDAGGVRQPDVVFETVGGRADTLDLALEAVRPGGSIVALGLFTRTLTLDPLRFLAKEARIVPSTMYSRRGPRPDFVVALELLRDGRAPLASLITHRFELDAIDQAFAAAADKRSGAIKVAVDVDQKR